MNDITLVYEKAYEVFKKMSWVEPDPFGLNWFLRWHLSSKFDPRYNKKLLARYKALFPKRKKVNLLDLPEEVLKETQAEIMPSVNKYFEKKAKQYVLLDNWLYVHAREVVLSAPEQIVYTSDFSTYSSQGYGMERYTIASCERIANVIRDKGIPCQVKPCYYDKEYNVVTDILNGKNYAYRHRTSTFEVSEKERDLYPFGYCVVAPLTKGMLDAILRTTGQTELEWAKSCWKTGTNPKVMNPFLSDEIYEKSRL